MGVLWSSLGQMGYLFFFIVLGFVLVKCRAVKAESAGILAKLENTVFIPALVLGTFIQNFTVSTFRTSAKLLLISTVLMLAVLPLALFLPRLLVKDAFTRNIYTYGLEFANFGFMGNAVVMAMFPDIFADYLVFCIPLWSFIYLWGVPKLLIPAEEKPTTVWTRLKPLCNPMFAAMIVGMVLGLLGVTLPSWLQRAVTDAGNCMSPVAMLLTGITVAALDFKSLFTNKSVYLLSLVRLLVIPLAFLGVQWLCPMDKTIAICATCSLAMPLGLNTIVVPSAYGKDPSTATSMTIVSHLFSCVTIPVVFLLMTAIVS